MPKLISEKNICKIRYIPGNELLFVADERTTAKEKRSKIILHGTQHVLDHGP